MNEEEKGPQHVNGDSRDDGTADAALDKRLAEPLLKGEAGIEAAQVWISAFLIVIIGLVAYSNAFTIPLHQADQRLIVANEPLHSPATFSAGLDGSHPRPLSMLSLALTWWTWDANPLSYHVPNIALHLANGVLLFLLARRFTAQGGKELVAMAAGVLFVLHPLAIQSVNQGAHRANLLGLFFVLLTIVLFLRAYSAGEKVKEGALAASFICFLLALASHEGAWVLPVLILSLDWALHKGEVKNRLRTHLLYWAAAPAFLVALFAADVVDGASTLANVKVQSAVLGSQFFGLLFPHDLSVYHALSADESYAAFPIPLIAAMIASLVLLRFIPPLGFFMLWYVMTLTGSVLGESPATILDENRAYMALAGPILIVSWLFSVVKPAPARMVLGVAAAGLMILCGVATYQRNHDWRDEGTLWNDALERYPDSRDIHRTLSRIYFNAGESTLRTASIGGATAPGSQKSMAEDAASQFFGQSFEHVQRAVELGEDSARTYALRGRLYETTKDRDKALQDYMSALRLDLGNQEYTLLAARNLLNRDETEGGRERTLRALDYYRRADSLGPLGEEDLTRFVSLLRAFGHIEEALETLEDPAADVPVETLSQMKDALTQTLQTVRTLERRAFAATERNAASPESMRLRGQANMIRGRYTRAFYELSNLHSREAGDEQSWSLLGVCKAVMNDPQAFLSEWPEPPGGSTVAAWTRLAQTCASMNRWDAALAYLDSDGAATVLRDVAPVLLGKIAAAMGQAPRAAAYFRQGADLYPFLAEPWLGLADLAIAQKQSGPARQYLAEAEKRGADRAVLAERRQRAGLTPPSDRPVVSIIR